MGSGTSKTECVTTKALPGERVDPESVSKPRKKAKKDMNWVSEMPFSIIFICIYLYLYYYNFQVSDVNTVRIETQGTQCFKQKP